MGDSGGRVLLNCHAGCLPEDVVAALGLGLADLYDTPTRPAGQAARGTRVRRAPRAVPGPAQASPADAQMRKGASTRVRARKVAEYPYCDEAGQVLGWVNRMEPKDFRWQRPTGDGLRREWRAPARRPLYRLPAVLAAVAAGELVYVAEGEKDAEALAAAGVVGTCNPGGAGPGKWRDEHTAALAGARVVVVADRDEAGYRHAGQIARALSGVAASVAVVESAAGKDAAEHLAAGHAPADFRPVPEGEDRPPADVVDLPSRRKLKDGGGGGDGGGASEAPKCPAFRVSMSQGSWRYSVGSDGFERGVYRRIGEREAEGRPERSRWVPAAPLPYVWERLTRRDGEGHRVGIDFRLSMSSPGTAGAEVAVCDADEVKTGDWADRLDVTLSADDKIARAVATAIRDAGRRFASARERAPRWQPGGNLELPPTDVGPAGYGETTPDEDAARAGWREIAGIAAAHPKLALAVGVSLGGMFVEPLNRQPFMFLMVGDARAGKTTALTVGGSLYGRVDHIATAKSVVQPWNTSPIGLTASLGELACLPAFRDELGASGLSSTALEALIFRLTQGASRTVGKRLGGSRTSASWRAPFLSTGNVGLLGRMTNEGIAARVIEVSTPIVGTAVEDPAAAADAERVELLALEHYGWPLRWLTGAGADLDAIRAAVDRAETDLAIDGGGVGRTLGQHLALAVAGAELFETVTGTTGARAAALEAAGHVLVGLVAELSERGARPAERLLSAIMQAVVSRPHAFPSKSEYLRAAEGIDGSRLAREVEGFTLEATAAGRAQIAVLPIHLGQIAGAVGMDDTLPALRQLRDDGTLAADGDSVSRLQKAIRLGVRNTRCYVFRLPEDPEGPAEPVTADSGGPAPVIGPTEPLRAPESAEPGPPGVLAPPATDAAESAAVAGSTGEVAPTPPAGPARETAGRYRAPLVVCAQLTGAFPDGTVQLLPDEAASDLPALLAWAEALGLGMHHKRSRDDSGQVWILPALAAKLGLPDKRPADGRAKGAQAVRRLVDALTAAGWKLGQRGLGDWTTIYREGGRSLQLVIPGWLERGSSACPMWDPTLPAVQLARRLGEYADRVGMPFLIVPGVTAVALLRSLRRGDDVEVTEAAELPEPALGGGAELDYGWQRPPTRDELERCEWAQVFDANGQYLAASSSVRLGIGQAVHVDRPSFDPKLPGYWRVDPGPRPDRLLPDLFDPTDRGRDGFRWVTTPTLIIARELGYELDAAEAWVWSTAAGRDGVPGSRYLEPWYRRLRDARAGLVDAAGNDPDAGAVLAAIKRTYANGIGQLGAPTSAGLPLYRPDWRHHVVATARANLTRKLVKVAEATGRRPLAVHHDAIVYAADSEDPAAACPAGLRLGTGLGEFKPQGTARLADLAELLQKGSRAGDKLMSAFRRPGDQ